MVDLGKRSPSRGRSLIGRTHERTVLHQHLDAALAGRGSLALVSGEAGIGKTTLVEHLGVRAVEAGAVVLWGRAYDLSITPPYGPWVEILWQCPRSSRSRASMGAALRLTSFAISRRFSRFVASGSNHNPMYLGN